MIDNNDIKIRGMPHHKNNKKINFIICNKSFRINITLTPSTFILFNIKN